LGNLKFKFSADIQQTLQKYSLKTELNQLSERVSKLIGCYCNGLSEIVSLKLCFVYFLLVVVQLSVPVQLFER